MSLKDFFRVNMPYGMKKNSENNWMAFNREYVPIGWCRETPKESIRNVDAYNSYPIHSAYKKLTEKKIESIIKDKDLIHRNEKNEINMIFFYHDGTNPQSNPEHWDKYFKIIKEFSKLETENY